MPVDDAGFDRRPKLGARQGQALFWTQGANMALTLFIVFHLGAHRMLNRRALACPVMNLTRRPGCVCCIAKDGSRCWVLGDSLFQETHE